MGHYYMHILMPQPKEVFFFFFEICKCPDTSFRPQFAHLHLLLIFCTLLQVILHGEFFWIVILHIDEDRCRKVPQMLHGMASAMFGKPLLMTTFYQVSSIVLYLQHPIFKFFMENLLVHFIDI